MKQTILLTVEEARTELRIGRTLFYDLVKRGHIQLIKVGRCSRTSADGICRLVADIASGKVVL